MPSDKVQKENSIRVGVFSDLRAADAVVARLLDAGYTTKQVSVICSDEAKTNYLREQRGVESDPASGGQAPEAAAEGGVVGGAIGALGGFVAAMGAVTAGAGVAVAGPLLALTAAGGAVVGTLVNEMKTRGVEHEAADFYDRAVQNGKILVAVDVGSSSGSETVAERIFEEMSALPVELPRG